MIKLKYKSWKDITIEVFEKLNTLKGRYKKQEDVLNTNVSMLAILCDVSEDDILALPLNEFGALLKETEFIKELPKYVLEDNYTINGREFEVELNIKKLTTAQYIDFQTLFKEKDKNFKNILACFVVPKGKKYGEYDAIEVADFLYKNMSIVQARSVMFFFTLQYQALIKVMADYSVRKMRKAMRKTTNKETKEKLNNAITNLMQLSNSIKNGVGFI